MSEKPISPLRQRMIEDMTVRNFIEKTRNDYIRQVWAFTAFLRRSPDTTTPEDLRRFQLHQTQTGVRPPSINAAVAALRFHQTARSARTTASQEGSAAGVTRDARDPPCSRGRGYLPRPRSRLASCQRRPYESRPAEGDERNRELPHGGSRRACRTL